MQTKTLAAELSYIGTDFHGFARQQGLATIQGALEDALATVFRHPVETVGAGRTDSGVHAYGQVVSFQLEADELANRQLSSLVNSLNALTPDSILIRSIAEKPEGFSARFSAVSREYRYRIVVGDIPPLFIAPFAWWLSGGYINVSLMQEAADLLVGEHDFRSFCVAGSAQDRSTVREISSINIFGMDHLGESCIVVQVIGNAFLHSMIRIMVGTLAEVGLGRRDPQWLAEVLAAENRQAAGQTAPAQGLTLWRVRY
ncbi:MAG: tRNA pseudouridine(38-40) synthase TruA [Coriobacteriales bacterium]|jgi:tRNA pseudouridine38-40 synthase|nr:tRNA pseudouridine(38-40) synthase TruA [Coriobacteriales bacterium]